MTKACTLKALHAFGIRTATAIHDSVPACHRIVDGFWTQNEHRVNGVRIQR